MVEFLLLSSLLTLSMVSGRRPTAQKSITSSIVLKYPRSCFNFSLNYTRIDKSVPIRTLCWRSTGFQSEQYMSSTIMNPTLSTPMTGMRFISCRWSSIIQEGNDRIIRWLLCRQIIVPGLWCFSLSDLRGCGTAPRLPAGFSTLEISGLCKIY